MEPNILPQLLVMSIITAFATLLIRILMEKHRSRDIAKRQAEIDGRHAEHEARVEHQLRSTQLNHGNRVFNWLEDVLDEYLGNEIDLTKMANNGPEGKGSYSIFITRLGNPSSPMVQLDFDFVGKHGADSEAHVFYGAYGPDIYFSYLEHSPFYGLNKLVLHDVVREAAEMKALGFGVRA